MILKLEKNPEGTCIIFAIDEKSNREDEMISVIIPIGSSFFFNSTLYHKKLLSIQLTINNDNPVYSYILKK